MWIYFLHLNQSSVEHFVGDLAYGHASPFWYGNEVSLDFGIKAGLTNYLIYRRVDTGASAPDQDQGCTLMLGQDSYLSKGGPLGGP